MREVGQKYRHIECSPHHYYLPWFTKPKLDCAPPRRCAKPPDVAIHTGTDDEWQSINWTREIDTGAPSTCPYENEIAYTRVHTNTYSVDLCITYSNWCCPIPIRESNRFCTCSTRNDSFQNKWQALIYGKTSYKLWKYFIMSGLHWTQ